VFSLTEHVWRGTKRSVDDFSREITDLIQPPATLEGLENLPQSARFLPVDNRNHREGIWIIHCASVITQAIRAHYGPGDPPVRWIVTANWPRIGFGRFSVPSPGDILLPRVANALSCYPVAFAGANPRKTARSLRRILKESRTLDRPIGLFPEGVGGSAGVLTEPLQGVDRLISHLARQGLPALPVGISEHGRFLIRFGKPISPEELNAADDAAALCMQRIGALM
jgi:hypothetical protein